MARACPIDVFEYLDYRAFLRDYYVAKKGEGKGFSYRAFSMRAGVRSPNHLKRVTDGTRNLSAETAVRYTQALGLEGDEASYFLDLVVFTQARTPTERSAAYEKMKTFRRYRKAHKLDIAQAAFHSTWYLPAIYELVLRADFSEEPSWIAKHLVPSITPTQARRGVETLEDLGLLIRKDGRLVQSGRVMTTGDETRGVHVVSYHRAMMRRAAESIDIIEAAERDISSLTFCVGEEGLHVLKARIQQFRKELIAMAVDMDQGEQVVQLNMQLFPLSTSAKTSKKKKRKK